MRFLVPVGGAIAGAYGVMTGPKHRGIAAGVRAGLPWAADNGAFTGAVDPGAFSAWLGGMSDFRASCLFVTVPDAVADASATIALFYQWRGVLAGWPLAFVAQDGQENLSFPDGIAAVFVGGSTTWKESEAAISVIKRAQAAGLHVHIGRVNWGRRYRLFRQIAGSDAFTCDGTRTRFDGVDLALAEWKKLEDHTNVMAFW